VSAMVRAGLGSASLRVADGTMWARLVRSNPVGARPTPGDKYFYFAAPFG